MQNSLCRRTELCRIRGFVCRYAAKCRPLYDNISAMRDIYKPMSLKLICMNESCWYSYTHTRYLSHVTLPQPTSAYRYKHPVDSSNSSYRLHTKFEVFVTMWIHSYFYFLGFGTAALQLAPQLRRRILSLFFRVEDKGCMLCLSHVLVTTYLFTLLNQKAGSDGECFRRVLYFAAIDRFYSFVVVRILSLMSFAWDVGPLHVNNVSEVCLASVIRLM
jgi:hypothetical protein